MSSNPIHGEVYSIQHYVTKLVNDFRQVGIFLRFPPLIKLAPRYNWNIVESGVKHHRPKSCIEMTESQMCSMDYTRYGLNVQQIQNVNVSFVLVCKHSAKFQTQFNFRIVFIPICFEGGSCFMYIICLRILVFNTISIWDDIRVSSHTTGVTTRPGTS